MYFDSAKVDRLSTSCLDEDEVDDDDGGDKNVVSFFAVYSPHGRRSRFELDRIPDCYRRCRLLDFSAPNI